MTETISYEPRRRSPARSPRPQPKPVGKARRAPTPSERRTNRVYSIDAHLDHLRDCTHWLIYNGVAIELVELTQNQPVPFIYVTSAPALTGFGDITEAYGRREVGNQVLIKLRAPWKGCMVLWENKL